MSDLVSQINDQFLKDFESKEGITSEQVEALRQLMQKDTKLKPKEIELIFLPDQDDVQ